MNGITGSWVFPFRQMIYNTQSGSAEERSYNKRQQEAIYSLPPQAKVYSFIPMQPKLELHRHSQLQSEHHCVVHKVSRNSWHDPALFHHDLTSSCLLPNNFVVCTALATCLVEGEFGRGRGRGKQMRSEILSNDSNNPQLEKVLPQS